MMDVTGQIIGNYRLIAPLDDDGRVARYRTTDPLTGQSLVLALLPDDPNAPVDDLARLTALVGPHIVPILDWGTAAGWRYLALPELRGGSARRLLAARDAAWSQSSRAAIALVRQAAEGVGYAHARGIAHGELRPERLLLDEDGPERGVGAWVRVALFGLGGAEPVAEARPYAAPERRRGEAPTARGDVYALGAILGEALFGQIPDTGADTTTASIKDMSREGGASVWPALDAILRRCLAAAPAARYADANELAVALRAAMEGATSATVTPDAPGIAIALRPPALTLIAGEPTALRVALGNGTEAAQRLTLDFAGAPAGWLAEVPEEVYVAPGAMEEVELTVTATRDAHEPAGEYPVLVRVVPEADAAGAASVRTLWTLRPFAAGALTVTPSDDRAVQTIRLHNQGNASQRHTLAVTSAPPLRATIAPATLDLDPDESATATVRLTGQRRLLGRATQEAFTVEARVTGAEPLRATGEFIQPARVPLWALPLVLLALVALACGIAYAVYPQGPTTLILPLPLPTTSAALDPTPIVAAPAATSTSIAAAGTPRAGEPLTLSVMRLDFGSVPIGGNGVQTLQVKNVSGHPVTFASIEIAGAAANDFVRAGPCGLEALDTALNCPLTIIFTPSGLGTRDARVEMTPAGGTTQFVTLVGTTTATPAGTPQIDPPTGSPPPLAGARSGQAAATLADGRRLLVVGGRNGQNLLKSAEVYDLALNSWYSTRDMSVPRAGHSATTLPDGTVVVIGGRGSGGPLRTAEVYDPTTGSWSPFPALTTAREGHSATVFVNGRTKGYQIFVLGGLDQHGAVLTSGERYDSTTNTWTKLARLVPDGRARHTATLLPAADNETPRILVVGGVLPSGEPAPAQLFDPSGTGSWRTVAGEPAGLLARTDFTATRIAATGQVLFIGGTNGREDSGAIVSYDPATARWGQPDEGLASGRTGQSATLLAYGRILLVGGKQGGRETATTVLLDPTQFTPAPAPTPAPATTPTPAPIPTATPAATATSTPETTPETTGTAETSQRAGAAYRAP